MAKATKGNPTAEDVQKAEARKMEKQARFREVAGRRVNDILGSFETLMSCTNKSNYDWTDEQAASIVSALRARIDTLEGAFKGEKAGGFKL
mgnify:CR=1 FL=1